MKVAFHAPLKAPDHPVPSGDRAMARALLKTLGRAGCRVEQPSGLRTFLPAPDPARQTALRNVADAEADRIAAVWARDGAPDLWFTYHNYYKAPDLLGPSLCRRFGCPYVVAEASSAPRRAAAWADWCTCADIASRAADMHVCFTARDREGIARIANPQARLVDLPPFIDLEGCPPVSARRSGDGARLLTVAMMRPGDKLASYRFLAEALRATPDRSWHLTVVGDGPARAEVEHAFSDLAAGRLAWPGKLGRAEVWNAMGGADLFVWPGFGEAFGLAYLEAQATGLPVVALGTAGVPSVVRHGSTGLLVDRPTPAAYADALQVLMKDPAGRARMGAEAARFVRSERALEGAAAALGRHLDAVLRVGSAAHV